MVVQRSELTELSKITIEEVTDPVEIARSQAAFASARLNSEWLESHWDDLPDVEGRFVAVANQQAFVADTGDAAWQWAQTNHPDDDGAIVQYVPKGKCWRIYAGRWSLGDV